MSAAVGATTEEGISPSVDSIQPELNPAWQVAVQAAREKQAVNIAALDLRGVTTMSDMFIVCHGRNARQNQAIADEIEIRLKHDAGERALAVEGYNVAEWILMDYGDFVVHVFSERARDYYDLERLYRGATKLQVPAEEGAA